MIISVNPLGIKQVVCGAMTGHNVERRLIIQSCECNISIQTEFSETTGRQ
jgi:hypothetical protein